MDDYDRLGNMLEILATLIPKENELSTMRIASDHLESKYMIWKQRTCLMVSNKRKCVIPLFPFWIFYPIGSHYFEEERMDDIYVSLHHHEIRDFLLSLLGNLKLSIGKMLLQPTASMISNANQVVCYFRWHLWRSQTKFDDGKDVSPILDVLLKYHKFYAVPSKIAR